MHSVWQFTRQGAPSAAHLPNTQPSAPLHATSSRTHAAGSPPHWKGKQVPPSGQDIQGSHSLPKGHLTPTPADLPVNWHTLMAALVSSSVAGTQLCEPSG